LQHQPQVVFLDIEMPFMNGFDLLEKLGKIGFKPIIISAYDQFGIKALKSNVFDYIVKPIDPLELTGVIERYMKSNSLDNSLNIRRVLDRLIIPSGQDIRFISLDRLLRCESDNNYTRLIMEDGESIFISKTLKSIEQVLPPDQFLRTHNRHIINILFIKRYSKTEGGFFELLDGTIIPLSRYKKQEILRQLNIK
jgi:two-component system LytT family response regulator